MKKKLLRTLLIGMLGTTMALGLAACGEVENSHTHTFADGWEKDSTGHWHAATCEHTTEKDAFAAHVYDNDEDTDCNVCGYERNIGEKPVEHEHTFATEWSHDATNHWHAATCEHTEEKADSAAHVYDNDEDATCNTCGYERTVEQPTYSAPVITLEFGTEITVTAGVEINPYFDVTATDEYDGDLSDLVDIENVDGLVFENPTVGTYKVIYSVTNSKGVTGTAERTYIVEAPKPNVILEVETERDDNTTTGWVAGGHEAGKMVFTNEQYIVIDENTAKTTEDGVDANGKEYKAGVVYYQYAITGIFHNSTKESVVVHMQGSGGEVAILDSAGYVVEARDGANGQFVCAEQPIRSSALTSFTYEGGTYPATSHGYYMVIPAGGWAVVISNDGTFGEQGNFNADGRGWLNKNLVRYGYAANLYFEDAPETLLNEYFDHAPVILMKNDVQVRVNDSSVNINELVVEGINYSDDDGTWTAKDDVTSGLLIEVVGEDSKPAFDITKEGTYVFTLKITDTAGNFTEFTRNVIVIPAEATVPTIEIDGIWYSHATLPIGVNVAPSENPDNYYAIVYTSYYVGEFIRDDYGCYFVVDANGVVVETYQPQNQKYYRQGEDGIVAVEKSYIDILQGVEIPAGGYVVLAVYSADANNFNVPMRTRIAQADRMLGSTVNLLKIDYLPAITVTPEGGTARKLSGTTMYINQPAPSATAASKATALIYDKTYGGEIVINAYGAAVVVKDGKIVRIFDENGFFYSEQYYWADDAAVAGGNRISGTSADLDAKYHFNTTTFAQVAFDTLEDGEYVIIFPNDGVNTADNNSPRVFSDGLRQGFLKYTVTLNFEIPAWEAPEEPDPDPVEKMTLVINGGTLELNTVAINVDGAKPADYDIHVYTIDFAGTLTTNSYGVAIVVRGGKIVRVYDGANGKYRDETQPDGNGDIKCDPAQYITEAFNSLEEGEYMIVFPNGNDSRAWALNNARTVGATVVLNVPEWEEPEVPATEMVLTIGSAELKSTLFAINVDGATVADYEIFVYAYGFEGTLLSNGYGIATVVSGGKIVRVYDGANGAYRDETQPTGGDIKCTPAAYITEAFNSLKAGEYMIVFPNDAARNQTVRSWGNANARTIGATVALVAPAWEEPEVPVAEMTVTIGSAELKSTIFAFNVDGATVADYEIFVYTYGFEGTLLSNGYGIATVVNEEGKIVRVYDGANGAYRDETQPTGGDIKCNSSTYASDAFASLTAGEYVIVFPNDAARSQTVRSWGNANARTIGATVAVSGINL